MKTERVPKSRNALSHDRIALTGEGALVPSVSQPRLTPESVQDFNVREEGSADYKLPQPDRSARQGTARRGARVDQAALESLQTAAHEASHLDDRANSEEFRQGLYQRYTAPYVPAVPYHRWGINE